MLGRWIEVNSPIRDANQLDLRWIVRQRLGTVVVDKFSVGDDQAVDRDRPRYLDSSGGVIENVLNAVLIRMPSLVDVLQQGINLAVLLERLLPVPERLFRLALALGLDPNLFDIDQEVTPRSFDASMSPATSIR